MTYSQNNNDLGSNVFLQNRFIESPLKTPPNLS